MARPTKQIQDAGILTAALEGLELQKKRIEEQISTVRGMLGRRGPGRPPASAAAESTAVEAPVTTRKKRVLSEEARLRIAAAQKKRWANFRKKG
jgi:hypothetical protein